MAQIQAAHAADAMVALRERVAAVAAASRARAQALDRSGEFPTADIAALGEAGAMAAVLPSELGGLGLGTEPGTAADTAALLMTIGSGSVAVGRVFEGHLNAIRLVVRNGGAALRRAAAQDARHGEVFALWVTDGPDGVRLERTDTGFVLQGQKLFCSAARHATRAVITAADAAGDAYLVLVALGRGERTQDLPAGLQGVRSAGTGGVDFTGVQVDASAVMGAPGAYLAEPEFAVGAWRASAVTAGALTALVEAARAELVERKRAHSAEQRERLGRMMINAQSARMWVRHVAPIAEDADRQPEFAAATVNLTRIAIEAAALDTIPLVQRSLGLSAFMQSNPVERMCRDLATYLRQPAPDEALRDAATYFTGAPAGINS